MTIGPRKIGALVGAIVAAAALVISHRLAGDTGVLVLVSVLQLAIVLAILEARVAVSRKVERRARELTRVIDRHSSDLQRDLAGLQSRLKQDMEHADRQQQELIGRFTEQLKDESKTTERRLRHLHERITSHSRAILRDQYQQLEALIALYHDTQPKKAFPPLRHWVASPDLLHYLYRRVIESRPTTILELGSGVSTVVMAYALSHVGGGRIVSLEHDQHYRNVTLGWLIEHELADWVDLHLAPLQPIDVDGNTYSWYSTQALPSDSIDLVLVDGPPGDTQSRARYPALPLAYSRLSSQAAVILDDYGRDDEHEIAELWAGRYPDLTLHEIRHEKGTAVFTF